MINNGIVITSLEIAGKVYPIYIRLVNDFSPLVLGQDFFHTIDGPTTQGKI